MNFGSDPADQIVRYTLEGTEMALKLSGLAAKNFAMFVYAVLKDQKKTHGKTHLVRMLKEERPLKFFTVPTERMREFAQEANRRGLLFVPIRNKKNPENIELVVFADDAAKVNRVLDCLNLDYVKAEAGEAVVESGEPKRVPKTDTPTMTETAQTETGAVLFEIGGFEDDFAVVQECDPENFTQGRESDTAEPPTEKNPSGTSSPSKDSFSEPQGSDQKPSVRKELQEIKREKEQKAQRTREPQRTPSRSRKKKKKQKGR